MISFIEMSRKVKSIEVESRLVVARPGGKEKWGVTANGYQITFYRGENVLELESGNPYTTLSVNEKRKMLKMYTLEWQTSWYNELYLT